MPVGIFIKKNGPKTEDDPVNKIPPKVCRVLTITLRIIIKMKTPDKYPGLKNPIILIL